MGRRRFAPARARGSLSGERGDRSWGNVRHCSRSDARCYDPRVRKGGRMTDKSARGPLDGLKVVDLTEHMAGPYCTMILADMGADVIKVERPGAGDSSRAMGDGSERNPYFRYINRNKKSLTLDYKSPRGKEILLELVAGMDVLVENYRPTVMERAGLG